MISSSFYSPRSNSHSTVCVWHRWSNRHTDNSSMKGERERQKGQRYWVKRIKANDYLNLYLINNHLSNNITASYCPFSIIPAQTPVAVLSQSVSFMAWVNGRWTSRLWYCLCGGRFAGWLCATCIAYTELYRLYLICRVQMSPFVKMFRFKIQFSLEVISIRVNRMNFKINMSFRILVYNSKHLSWHLNIPDQHKLGLSND